MSKTKFLSHPLLLAAFAMIAAIPARTAPSLMENLGRGVVAVRSAPGEIFVSWRLLGTDPEDTVFNLYRAADGGAPVKLNAEPLAGATCFQDTTFTAAQSNEYFVRPVIYGNERAPGGSFTVPANAGVQPYLRLPLQIPAGTTTPDGVTCAYSANDCSVGDLDGDGEYEIIVKWDPSNSKDNSESGYTGNVYLDAYKLDGTRLWRIDLGKNIRAGAHYTQFMVYDLDGDGKAEVACKTADATVDGQGTVIGNAAADHRNTSGHILTGPEYLTVFNGQTGAALATVAYLPRRNPDTGSDSVTSAQQKSIWGNGDKDDYGNRMNRFLACVAYLDGQRPSLVMCRGYYNRSILVAWDFRDGQLVQRWTFDSGASGTGADGKPNSAYAGQGNHNLTATDVDGDGRDEIIYGSMTVNPDGTGRYSTGLGHGDALHVSKMIPSRPGLQAWFCHEEGPDYGHSLRDASTGEILLRIAAEKDTGRAAAAHIDARYPGYQVWGARADVIDATTKTTISTNRPAMNFLVWWDGDLQRELLDGTDSGNGPPVITKWGGSSAPALLAFPTGVNTSNSTKANPALSGDILGDWREEIVLRETDSAALRIYTSTAPTAHRIPTLMHDRQYRLSIAWQNVAYNQPPHTSFYIGASMEPPPVPDIVTSLDTLLGPAAPVITAISDDTGSSSTDFITSDTTLVLHGTATPGVTVTITRDGTGPVGTAVADGAGAWSFDYTGTALPEGETRFTTAATDAQNRTGAPSLSFTVTIKTAPPSAPAMVSVTGGATLTFAGTAAPGATVTIIDSVSGPLGTAVADAGGAWTFSHAGSLSAGDHTFTASAADIAGNISSASAPSAPVAIAPVLEADKTLLTLAQGAAAADTITVTANLAWSASAAPIGAGAAAGWLAVTPSSGTAGTTLLTAKTSAANSTGAPRTAAVTLSADGAAPRSVIVTQLATASSGAAPAALATGGTLSLTLAGRPAEIYTIAGGGKLAPAGGTPVPYEYAAAGDTATLIFDDSVWALDFTAKTLRFYDTDGVTGSPYELAGTFTYAPPPSGNTDNNSGSGGGGGAPSAWFLALAAALLALRGLAARHPI